MRLPYKILIFIDNADLVGCTVALKEGGILARFLVIDVIQFILVEPDKKRLGWGVAKFVGFLQDIEVEINKENSKCLHVTVHRYCDDYNFLPWNTIILKNISDLLK